MNRSKTFLVIFLFWVGAPMAFSAPLTTNPNEMLLQANAAYEQGNLDNALDIYQSLANQGFEGVSLFYNLGNVFYRRGERGKAVLWYERAARLAPRDSDVQFNLTLARSHIKEEGDSLSKRLLFFFTSTELGWISVFLSWIFFLLIGAKTLGWIEEGTPIIFGTWLSGISLVVFAGWFAANSLLANEPEAIVIAPPGEVRNGPGLDYAVGFTVPEGSKVVLLNRRPEWTQVGVLNQGLKGWLPSKEVERVNALDWSS